MSTTDFDTFRNLKKGRTNWKVKCRVIREWRGVTQTGEVFKNFNLILLDAENCMMHAFAPTNVADRLGKSLQIGKIYIIKNFQVKDYTLQDKFRPVHMDRQIIFTSETRALEDVQTDVYISKNMFDFFQFHDLQNMARQQLNLIDVIGLIQRDEIVQGTTNKNGKSHDYIKFKLNDGRKKINVTFWGSMAEQFHNAMTDDMEEPVILIIASGKISSWQDEIDISNYSPTKFYLNYDHHSVFELRKKLKDPSFYNDQCSTVVKLIQLCTVNEITELGKNLIQEEVVCKATLKSVKETTDWNVPVCTTCYTTTELKEDDSWCPNCKRIVPHPLKRFNISAMICDKTGGLEIRLTDREMRTVLGKNVEEVENQDKSFPKIIKAIEEKQYSIRLLITEDNVNKNNQLYVATNICEGFDFDHAILKNHQTVEHTQSSTMQPSGSSYHLDSSLN